MVVVTRTSLHKACHLGCLRSVASLLQAGASLDVEDYRGRQPLDLVSHELRAHLKGSTVNVVYSWGSGSNYQLGTASTDERQSPGRVEGLHGVPVTEVAAAKFHSAALAEDGRLYTWGWGRGGRLGHPDAHIHTGEGAQILPRVVSGLGKRQVVSMAAGKHHMVVATTAGEVFTWGSNRDGKLGYSGVDTQPTPRKISTMKWRVVAVAAANKHSAAITSAGELFTWGANGEGQLGYGTSAASANYNPRVVDALKGREVVQVSMAKRHTVALTGDGEVHMWGHKQVTPRKVNLYGSRDTARLTGEVKFHRGQESIARPVAVAIAAGASHTSCITRTGVVLTWRSADPQLRVQEVQGPLAGKRIVSIAAGKLRTGMVTEDGDLYMMEAARGPGAGSQTTKADPGSADKGFSERFEASTPVGASPHSLSNSVERMETLMARRSVSRGVPLHTVKVFRVGGVKRMTLVAVGEKHSLAVHSRAVPSLLTPDQDLVRKESLAATSASRDSDDDLELDPRELFEEDIPHTGYEVPSLQDIAQLVVAKELVDTRTVLQLLEYADLAGAHQLRSYSLGVALMNLDTVILEARQALEMLSPHLLTELEQLYRAKNYLVPRNISSPFGVQQCLRPSQAPLQLGDICSSQEGPGVSNQPWVLPLVHEGGEARLAVAVQSALVAIGHGPPQTTTTASERNRFLAAAQQGPNEGAAGKLLRTLKKKLQQVRHLEEKGATGASLDIQQLAKVGQKDALLEALKKLNEGAPLGEVQAIVNRAQEVAEKLVNPLGARSASGPTRVGQARTTAADLPGCGDGAPTGSVPVDMEECTGTAETVTVQVDSCREASSGHMAPLEPVTPDPTSACKARKGSLRKGDLMQFLSGALDPSQPIPPKPTPPLVKKGPAWGGKGTPPATSSAPWDLTPAGPQPLTTTSRNATLTTYEPSSGASSVTPTSSSRARLAGGPHRAGRGGSAAVASGGTVVVNLHDLMLAKKKEVVAAQPTGPQEQRPAWGRAHGDKPAVGPTEGKSLKEIQEEQARQRLASLRLKESSSVSSQRLSSSYPGQSLMGASPTSTFLGSSPPSGHSRWYIQEPVQVMSLTAIQTEEAAIQELNKLYGCEVAVDIVEVGTGRRVPANSSSGSGGHGAGSQDREPKEQGEAQKGGRGRWRRSPGGENQGKRPARASEAEHMEPDISKGPSTGRPGRGAPVKGDLNADKDDQEVGCRGGDRQQGRRPRPHHRGSHGPNRGTGDGGAEGPHRTEARNPQDLVDRRGSQKHVRVGGGSYVKGTGRPPDWKHRKGPPESQDAGGDGRERQRSCGGCHSPHERGGGPSVARKQDHKQSEAEEKQKLEMCETSGGHTSGPGQVQLAS